MWGVRRILAAAVLAVMSGAAVAQVIPPGAQPGRERERFIAPQAPQARPGGVAVSLPSSTAPPGAAAIAIVIRRIHIVGSTVYGEADFAPLYQDLLGHRVSLQAVYDLAQRITAKYGADGYVLSRAVIPVQEFDPDGAVVNIEVIEGYIDRVEWPEKLKRYRDFFTDYALKITADRPSNIRTLERYLLLAGDLPGLKFITTLKASNTKRGASTLIVEVVEKPLDLYSRIDNRGTQSRGPYQFLSSATFNNIFGQHEALSIAYAGVWPLRELHFVAPSYRQVLNSEGLSAFVNASYAWGRPGTAALELLEYATRSTVVEAGMSFPVIRSRERNLTLTGLAYISDNHSDILHEPFNEDRLRGARFRADADMADSLRGINQLSFTVSHGIEGLGSTVNGNPLASRAVGRVDFTKVEGYAGRLQQLLGSFSAYLATYGQYAFNPLLTPEQCGYGGVRFGRAFDPSQLLGDSCFEALAELRYDFAIGGMPLTQLQVYGFSDYGKLWTRAASLGTFAVVDAASAGAGVRFGWTYFSADVSVAKAIEGPRDDWRTFFILAARY
jgi:hemolysin activation/secretion protein